MPGSGTGGGRSRAWSTRSPGELARASGCWLTNGAAAGEGPVALMTRAGHASMATTKRYLHLAGAVFRDEAEALERRLLGEVESR